MPRHVHDHAVVEVVSVPLALRDGSGGCFLFVPPDPNFLGWMLAVAYLRCFWGISPPATSCQRLLRTTPAHGSVVGPGLRVRQRACKSDRHWLDHAGAMTGRRNAWWISE